MSGFKTLELSNFKCFKLPTFFEWKQFSSIIGSNGAGKSTVVEAIEFVFCFDTYKITLEQLKKEVCNTNIDNDESIPNSSVNIVLCKDGQDTYFKRVINYDSWKEEFYIDESIVDKKIYKATLLEEFNINPKANNFLIRQNAIEYIAMDSPTQRREFFEQLSGSIDYRLEYNKLSKCVDSLSKEQTSLEAEQKKCQQRKKKYLAEVKGVEEHERQRQTLNVVECDYYTAQLYIIDENLMELAEEEEKLRKSKSLKSAEKEKLGLESQIEKLKELLQESKDALKEFEEEWKEMNKELTKLEDEKKKIECKMDSCERDRKEKDIRYQSAKKIDENREKNFQSLSKQYDDIQEEIYSLSQTQKCTLELESEQYEEYLQLKAQVEMECNEDINSRDALSRKCHFIKGILDEFNFKEDKLIKEIQQKEDFINKIESNKKLIEQKIKDIKLEEEKLKKELEKDRTSVNQLLKEIKHVEDEIVSIDEEIKDINITKYENKKEETQQEVLSCLQAEFGSDRVINRLKNLCECTDKSKAIAVTKIMAKQMDNIVVLDTDTAMECISFLKTHYAEKNHSHSVIETFLPLDFVPKQSLGKLQRCVASTPGAMLALEAIERDVNCPVDITNLLHHIMGKYVICSTPELATKLSYEKNLNCVTESGTLYRADGTFSGGMADVEKRTREWYIKHDKMFKIKRMEKLESLKNLQDMYRNLEERCRRLDRFSSSEKLKYLEKELNKTKNQSKEEQNQLSLLHGKLDDLRAQTYMVDEKRCTIKDLMQLLEEETEKMNNIKKKLEKHKDIVFKSFCETYNLNNIREYEQGDYMRYEENLRRKNELLKQLNVISSEKEYLQSRESATKDAREEAERKLKEQQDMYQSLNKQKKILENKIKKFKEDEPHKKERDELEKKVDGLKNEIKSKLKKIQQIEKNLRDRKDFEKTAPKEMDALISKKHELLLKCKTNDIILPLIQGSLDQITNSEDSYVDDSEIEIDYSRVIKDLKEHGSDVFLPFLKNKINTLKKELKSFEVDLRSNKLLKDTNEKIKQLKVDCKKKREERNSAKAKFNEIMEERCKVFNEFFESVMQNIDEIYKNLYRNDTAQAHLFASNPNEPYLGTVMFQCTVPGKTFTLMENLSGGEKSMATLAMVLATYKVKPTPFLILDEIDAALDSGRREILINYFLQLKEETQIIIISHHERLSSSAQVAVGISKSHVDQTSYNVHNDLQWFRGGQMIEDHCIKDTKDAKIEAMRHPREVLF